MRSILSILIGLVLCGSACAEAPTSGMLARYFGPGSTYGASTSVADQSGNSNTGTLNGGDTLATLHVGEGNGPGGNLANHGVTLDGSADYVNIPHATALNAYPITVAFWAKTTTNDASVRGAFVKYQSGSANGWSTHLANGTLYGWYWGATSGNRVYGSGNGVSAGAMNDGEWHHWTMVVDASGMTWYKDGAAVGAPTAWTGTPQASSSTFAMQVGQYSTFKFPGSIADAIVYNRALSLSEVGQVYAEGVDAPSALIRLRGIGGKLQTINGSPVGVSQ